MTVYALGDRTPQIHEDTWIAPGAHVIGDVVLEEGVAIWFCATLRGDNERLTVGAGTNVQENCVFHTDIGYPLTIGRDCTIGHKAMLHGCTIGNNTLIGMGAMVMNGAKVGNNCLIGANAMVTEGKEIPDGSLVMGAPGKVVRELDKAVYEVLAQSAAHYREKMRFYRSDLKAL